MNYKYTGNYTDWDGVKIQSRKRRFIKFIINKKIFQNFSLDIKNLLDKSYEKPATIVKKEEE